MITQGVKHGKTVKNKALKGLIPALQAQSGAIKAAEMREPGGGSGRDAE